MSGNSTRKPRRRKAGTDRPAKPYKDFPLYPHPLGYWSKKILGTIRHFGRWGRVVGGKLTRVVGDGWQEALTLYQAQRDDLYAGNTPRSQGKGGLTVKDLGDTFLTAKNRKLAAGELGRRMFEEYRATCQFLADTVGKDRRVDDLAGDDFERLRAALAERFGPVRLGNEITRVKSVFKYGIDNGLIEKAVRYGSEFKKPGKAVLRKHKADNGKNMLEGDEVRKLLATANAQMKAMILLGVNCGYGNTDVATLREGHLDLEQSWATFPRPKTGIDRRAALWPETVAALKGVLASRPKPKDPADAGLVFVLPNGRRWVRETEKSRTDHLSVTFGALLHELGINGRHGLGFYSLRHTFRTVADAARDPVATDIIMGHADPSMGGHYRERIEDARLRAVAEHVRAWLFPSPAKPKRTQTSKAKSAEAPPVAVKGDAPRLRLYAAG